MAKGNIQQKLQEKFEFKKFLMFEGIYFFLLLESNVEIHQRTQLNI